MLTKKTGIAFLMLLCVLFHVTSVFAALKADVANLLFNDVSFSQYVDEDKLVPASGASLRMGGVSAGWVLVSTQTYENQIAYIGPSTGPVYGKTESCLQFEYYPIYNQVTNIQPDVYLTRNVNVPVSEGDIVHISFEIAYPETTEKYSLRVQGIAEGQTAAKQYRIREAVDGSQWDQVNSQLLFSIYANNYNIFKTSSLNSNVARNVGFKPGEWQKVDVIVNTKDPAYDNQQTLYHCLNGVVKKVYILDANVETTDVVERFTHISNVRLSTTVSMAKDNDTNTYYHKGIIEYLDNFSVRIYSKNGMGVIFTGDAVSGANTFKTGTLTANVGVIPSILPAPAKVILAQYNEEGKLINIAHSQDKVLTSDDYELSTTMHITEQVGTVKAFLWDSFNRIKPLDPYIELKAATN